MGQVDELAGTFFGAIQMTTSTGTIPIAAPTITFLAGLTLAGGLTLTLTFALTLILAPVSYTHLRAHET